MRSNQNRGGSVQWEQRAANKKIKQEVSRFSGAIHEKQLKLFTLNRPRCSIKSHRLTAISCITTSLLRLPSQTEGGVQGLRGDAPGHGRRRPPAGGLVAGSARRLRQAAEGRRCECAQEEAPQSLRETKTHTQNRTVGVGVQAKVTRRQSQQLDEKTLFHSQTLAKPQSGNVSFFRPDSICGIH